MRQLRQAGVVLAMTLAAVSVVSAQRPARAPQRAAGPQGGFWELGADAVLRLGLNDPMTVNVIVPVDIIRAGYYASNVLSIEPILGLNSSFGQNQTASTNFAIGVGVPYHLAADRTKRQTFVRPMLRVDGNGNNSFITLGFGGGFKWPIFRGRLASRAELQLAHTLKDGNNPAQTNLNVYFGLSGYTR